MCLTSESKPPPGSVKGVSLRCSGLSGGPCPNHPYCHGQEHNREAPIRFDRCTSLVFSFVYPERRDREGEDLLMPSCARHKMNEGRMSEAAPFYTSAREQDIEHPYLFRCTWGKRLYVDGTPGCSASCGGSCFRCGRVTRGAVGRSSGLGSDQYRPFTAPQDGPSTKTGPSAVKRHQLHAVVRHTDRMMTSPCRPTLHEESTVAPSRFSPSP